MREGRDLLRSVLRAAQARGELPRSADIEGALHLLVGSYYARYLAGEHNSLHWPRDAVDLVLGGLTSSAQLKRNNVS